MAVVREGELPAQPQPLFCDRTRRIRLRQALAQRAAVALQPAAVARHEAQVPDDLVPDTAAALLLGPLLPRPQVAAGLGAQQADEVKVADDAGPQGLQHGELLVVVGAVEQRLGAAGLLLRLEVGGAVKVDGHAARVVQRAHEVVDGRVRGERLHQRRVRGPDELALEADQDVDLRGVLGLQTLGLDEVGLVPLWEDS